MLRCDVKSHWEEIYKTKPSTEVSWYQTRPSLSLKLIEATGIDRGQGIIDVGARAFTSPCYILTGQLERLARLTMKKGAI